MSEMINIEIDSVDDLPDVAEQILDNLCDRTVVAFYGPMGAGKTTIIREIAAQLGVEDTVTSPTFAIVNQYLAGSGEPVYHFDFYRIERLDEVFDMGYEEYFSSGHLCLIEWPEKIENLLPSNSMIVKIDTHPDDNESRAITII